MKRTGKIFYWLCSVLMVISLILGACAAPQNETVRQSASVEANADSKDVSSTKEETEDNVRETEGDAASAAMVEEDGEYSDVWGVSHYLAEYEKLPSNYITKNEARDLGWDSSAGNLWDVAPGKSIGGDRFGNREGLLPDQKGRSYYECDINYHGGYRGGERIVYSNDGLIFYTEDHYEDFVLLYDGEEWYEESNS